MLVVWVGIWLLSCVGKRLTYTSPKKKIGEPVNTDWFTKKYGGRLPGGGKMGTKGKCGVMAYGPGITARQALGRLYPNEDDSMVGSSLDEYRVE
eukprot:2936014-Karenia_brevis.AAC.1